MAYEIDVLAVGEKSHGGDAILIRYDAPKSGRPVLVAIDGGYTANGRELVDLVKRKYGRSPLDLVISTHFDQDHIVGLKHVVANLEVRYLAINIPDASVLRANDVYAQMNPRAVAVARTGGHAIVASAADCQDLLDIAKARNVEVFPARAPFRTTDGVIRFVGPDKDYFDQLATRFVNAPVRSEFALTAAVRGRRHETFSIETLSETSNTNPVNNASAVVLFSPNADERILFTGDAGAEALHRVADVLQQGRIESLTGIQVPHHGSSDNVTPSVLDRLLGPKGQRSPVRTAFVSCPKDASRGHPSDQVVNAFIRRGCEVFTTAGTSLTLSPGHRRPQCRDAGAQVLQPYV